MPTKISIIVLVIILNSCQFLNNKESSPSEETTKSINIPLFDENLAFSLIEKQVSFGPRVPSTPQHEACAKWILETIKPLVDTVYFQDFETTTYDGLKHKSKNIIAKINPQAKRRILYSAHWDTRPIADQDINDTHKPILGANDGGSGVGVLISLLQAIQKQKINIGLDIVLYDIEDYGQPEKSEFLPMENSYCLGSQYFASNFKDSIIPIFGVNIDMIGGYNATFHKEGISMLYAPNLVDRIWTIANQKGFGSIFVSTPGSQITDDHFYINSMAKIPMIDIIHTNTETGFPSYWHTHQDNMASVDKQSLKAVGIVLLQLLYEENDIKE